jgi:hypothetical protein
VDRVYTLTIACRRPPNRMRDEWNLQPERIARTVAAFVGGDATLTLTPRTARLNATALTQLPNPQYWQQRMGEVLDGLRLDVPRIRGEYQLPGPVRIEIRETTA